MKVTDFKVGETVTYIPRHSNEYSDRELGKVTSINDKFVFVDYGYGTSQATMPENLRQGDETFYCPDEHNSVLDGAFGRCTHRCKRCTSMEELVKNYKK